MNHLNLKMKQVGAFKLSLLAMMIVQSQVVFAKDIEASSHSEMLETAKGITDN